MTVIQLQNIKKSFANNEVLKGIDLTVNKSEVVVVMGPSGSGKSTLLRCITFLEEANEGIIRVGEHTLVASEKLNRKKKQ